MNIDTNAIDEAVLALSQLTLREHNRAWKSFDWDALKRQMNEASSTTLSAKPNPLHSLMKACVSQSGSLNSFLLFLLKCKDKSTNF